jgi:hypothetical protein
LYGFTCATALLARNAITAKNKTTDRHFVMLPPPCDEFATFYSFLPARVA